MLKYYVTLLLSFLMITSLFSGTRLDNQVWSDFFLVHGNEKVAFRHRIGSRLSLPNANNYLLNYRFRTTFGDGPLKYRFGTALFYSENSGINDYEIRPWGGLQLTLPLGSAIQFRNYFRLENRFIDQSVFSLNQMPLGRARYRFGLNTSILESDKSRLVVRFTPEVFMDLGNYNTFNYNELRLIGGINFAHQDRWEAGVTFIRQLFQYNALQLNSDFTNILQFTLVRNLL